jgi:hypothetical protein
VSEVEWSIQTTRQAANQRSFIMSHEVDHLFSNLNFNSFEILKKTCHVPSTGFEVRFACSCEWSDLLLESLSGNNMSMNLCLWICYMVWRKNEWRSATAWKFLSGNKMSMNMFVNLLHGGGVNEVTWCLKFVLWLCL